MPGRTYAALLERATERYGYVTTADAREVGASQAQLKVMARREVLDRVARGVYRFPSVPATPLDQYMEAVLWPRTDAVLSHETALDLHDLCDVNPARIHVTVPACYRFRRAVPPMYELHARNVDPRDITQHEGIPIVSVARSILDGIEGNTGGHLITQAIATARRRGLLAPEELRAITRVARTRRRSVAPRPPTA